MRGIRAVLLGTGLLLTGAAAPGAHADDGFSARYAVFSGPANPRTGGTATTCYEIVTSGPVTPLPCEASFTISVSRGVCGASVHTQVGTFDYFSPTTGHSHNDVELTTTSAEGGGYLVGYGTYGSRVLHARISVAALCFLGQPSGPFEGHLSYI